MPQSLVKFAGSISLPLSLAQADLLVRYAQTVWQKKDFLNLTSAANLQEVLSRHICDGLQGAACLAQLAQTKNLAAFSVTDAGAGAGYIGLTLAIALPQAQVTLVESIEKRCAFMNWVILTLGIKNARVKNARLGQHVLEQTDFVTERAMGQLADILPLCLQITKAEGAFMAYQGQPPQLTQKEGQNTDGKMVQLLPYTLPTETRERYLAIFEK